jgi:hypothetical protein
MGLSKSSTYFTAFSTSFIPFSLFDLESRSSLRPAVLQSRRAQELSRLAVGNLCSLTLRDISCCCDELGTDLCLLPQPEGDWNGIDVELLPPCRFVTRTMELAVMEPTNRNEKLVAYGAPKCTWLRKPER